MWPICDSLRPPSARRWATCGPMHFAGCVLSVCRQVSIQNVLYGELASGKRNSGRPQLRFKHACKRDMKTLYINMETWDHLASNRSDWRSTLRTQLLAGEKVLADKAEEKRERRKDAVRIDKQTTVTVYTCSSCGRNCRSRIGLFSHRRCCTNPST